MKDQGCEAVKVETKAKIVITIEGGVVSNVLSLLPLDVAIINYDVEGENIENLKKIPQGPIFPPSDAVAHVELSEIVSSEHLDEMFKAARGTDSLTPYGT